MSTGDIGIHEQIESCEFRPIAEARTLPDFHGHEVLDDDTGIFDGTLHCAVPGLRITIPERIVSIELDPQPVIDLPQEINRPCRDTHPEPRILQRFEHMPLD